MIALLIRMFKPLLLSPFSRPSLKRYLSTPKHQDLVLLKDLAETEKLMPVIDKTFPLAETPDALRHLETGHAAGKVVITI